MTPQQLADLKNEVEIDPKALGYRALLPDSPGVVVDLLNGPNDTAIKAISADVALTWAAKGPERRIVDAGNNASHPCSASCLAVQIALQTGQPIHMEKADIRAMFDGWLAAGVVLQAEHDELLTLAIQPASRAEVLGLGFVAEADLRAAGVL